MRYPYRDRDAVGPVSLTLRAGESTLLLGPSGAGKSTLLASLTGIVPQTIPAELSGDVSLFGEDVASRPPAGWAETVSRLFQNAEETLCGMTVADEIAFALENRGLPEADIARRIGRAMAAVSLPPEWRARRTMSLSGGEKQLVALAALVAQDATLVVVDEPTAHLAPAAARTLRELLFGEAAKDRTVLVVDHRLDGLVERIDRVVVLGPDGTVVADGPPRRVFRNHRERLRLAGVWLPLTSEIDAGLSAEGIALEPSPLTIHEMAAGIDSLPAERRGSALEACRAFVAGRIAAPVDLHGDTVVTLRDADCAPFLGPIVLRDVNATLRRGEAMAILGANGAGKSTLAACLAGVTRLKRGIREGAPGGIAFQNPEAQFLCGSVREEVADALRRSGAAGATPEAVTDTLRTWRLEGLEAHHPFELSQGQKRRLALACLTAGAPFPLLVLDEPTAGLDAAATDALARTVDALRRSGHALAIVTHDVDFALRTCPRAMVVAEGGVLADGGTLDLLRDAGLLRRAQLEPPALLPLLEWLECAASC